MREVTELNAGTFKIAKSVENFSGVGFGKGDSGDTDEFREEEFVVLPLFIIHIGLVRAPGWACVRRVLNGV